MAQQIRYYKKDGTEYSFSKEPEIKITQTSNADMNIGVPQNMTAVEFLFEKFFEVKWDDMPNRPIMFEQAKKMEREQIVDAHIEGQRVFDKHPHTQWTNDQAEQYYNENYGK